jgi:hypothetical protein
VTRGANAPSIEVASTVTIMNKKTYYKLWFVISVLYLLGAIYPLNVAQRTPEHRSFSLIMGIFFLSIGAAYKKKHEKSLIEAPATLSETKISQ